MRITARGRQCANQQIPGNQVNSKGANGSSLLPFDRLASVTIHTPDVSRQANALGCSPAPQGGQHGGQPQAGSSSTPGPSGGVRRGRIWREWRRVDPTLINGLWKSKTPLGNAEPYIVLALLIGFITVVIGCWLSDNCWSPEPEQIVTIA
ncbi:uncharacterized protein [Anabrus simplex]|uniref:uncharacterized protein n=1 Tax=Anabrus simplex TaxID=316456 RepID=UPI0034DD3E33